MASRNISLQLGSRIPRSKAKQNHGVGTYVEPEKHESYERETTKQNGGDFGASESNRLDLCGTIPALGSRYGGCPPSLLRVLGLWLERPWLRSRTELERTAVDACRGNTLLLYDTQHMLHATYFFHPKVLCNHGVVG